MLVVVVGLSGGDAAEKRQSEGEDEKRALGHGAPCAGGEDIRCGKTGTKSSRRKKAFADHQRRLEEEGYTPGDGGLGGCGWPVPL